MIKWMIKKMVEITIRVTVTVIFGYKINNMVRLTEKDMTMEDCMYT